VNIAIYVKNKLRKSQKKGERFDGFKVAMGVGAMERYGIARLSLLTAAEVEARCTHTVELDTFSGKISTGSMQTPTVT